MIRLRTLGESVIEVGALRVAPDADVLFAALLYLTAVRGRPQGRELLTSLFWPRLPHDRARHCLRQAVYKMRQIGVRLRCTHGHVELPAELIEPGFAAELSQDRLEEERRAGRLRLGTFLPGYAPTFSPAFGEWVERERDQVHSQVRRALLGAMQARKARGEWAEVESLARECLALDALNEEATLALAESAALSGGKTEAIAILDQYIQELGPLAGDIRVPATVLRRRIAERFPLRRYLAPAERCFVGRETLMAALSTALQRARNAEGGAILLWGPPGIGKTRLATEVRKVATLQGVRIVRAACEETDSARPMGVWIDAVPQLLALPGALGCAPESLTYLKRLTEHDPNATTPSLEVRDAAFLAASIRRAIVDLVDAVAGEHPLLLVLEDAHWADAASWNVLRELIDCSTTKRMLLLLTSRTPHPTPQPPSRVAARLEVLSVPPLEPRAGEALLRAAVPEDRSAALTGDIVAWCLSVGEGNPLFLHELASHWGETGRTHEAPASLQHLIDTRIATLRPTALYVLQTCAVLARNATAERLEALLELRVHELLACLTELSHARLVTEDEGRIAPLHEIVAQRVMLTIGGPALRLLHRNAAMVLEREVRAGDGTGVLWDCARHWQAAGDADRVLHVILAHAQHQIMIGCAAEATKTLTEALAHDLHHRGRAEILRALVFALCSNSQWRPAAEVASELLTLSQSAAGSPDLASPLEVILRLEARWNAGHSMEQVLAEAQVIAADSRIIPDVRLRAATCAVICADNMRDRRAATNTKALIEELLVSCESTLLARQVFDTVFQVSFGDIRVGAAAAARLYDSIEHSTPPLIRSLTMRRAAEGLRYAGEVAKAAEIMLEAYRIADEYQIATGAAAASDKLSCMLLDEGNPTSAEAWHIVSRRWIQRTDDAEGAMDWHHTAARLALARNEIREAQSHLLALERHEIPHWDRRKREAMSSLRCELALAESHGRVPHSLVSDLWSLHESGRASVAHDAVAYALCAALQRNEKDDLARLTLHEYLLVHRRSFGPLPARLLYLAQTLKAIESTSNHGTNVPAQNY